MKTVDDNFDWNDFSIGFWHPFGPHGGETPEQILARKANEISQNGWTVWSFASRSNDPEPEMIRWAEAIETQGPGKVFAFCSNSVARDKDKKGEEQNKQPLGARYPATSYRHPGSHEWEPLPTSVEVPHHFGDNALACAFKVRAIYHLPASKPQPVVKVEWLNSAGTCRSERLVGGAYYPTKGQYLLRLRSDSPARLRAVRAVLELDPPYVVTIRR